MPFLVKIGCYFLRKLCYNEDNLLRIRLRKEAPHGRLT